MEQHVASHITNAISVTLPIPGLITPLHLYSTAHKNSMCQMKQSITTFSHIRKNTNPMFWQLKNVKYRALHLKQNIVI